MVDKVAKTIEAKQTSKSNKVGAINLGLSLKLGTSVETEIETKTSSQEENQELITQNTRLTNEYKAASQELAEIKAVSADAVNLSQRSAKLESEVQQLLLQLDDIRIENEVLKDQSAKRWYVLGGGTVLIGLLLGWILSIARRPRRQSWGA